MLSYCTTYLCAGFPGTLGTESAPSSGSSEIQNCHLTSLEGLSTRESKWKSVKHFGDRLPRKIGTYSLSKNATITMKLLYVFFILGKRHIQLCIYPCTVWMTDILYPETNMKLTLGTIFRNNTSNHLYLQATSPIVPS